MRRIVSALCLAVPALVRAQQPLNLGFDRAGSAGDGRPWGWQVSPLTQRARVTLDSTTRHGGASSVRIALGGDTVGLASYVPVAFAAGAAIHVAGWVRADSLVGGTQVVLEQIGDRGVVRSDSTTPEGAAGVWTQFAVDVGRVAPDAGYLVLTLTGWGRGTIRFDDLTLTVNGRRVDAVPGPVGPTAAEMQWLRDATHPLRTTEPGGDDADLHVVDPVIAQARIIALGEATHGTREFFRAKHRLIEYLVRRHGVTLVAFEGNQLDTELANAYVRGGAGDARQAIARLFLVWRTEEVAALVDWLRSYNATGGHPAVELVGFDMQDPQLPVDSLRAFLAREAPEMVPGADSAVADYREAWRAARYPRRDDSVHTRWARDAQNLYERVTARRPAWLTRARSAADTSGVEWAVQNANVIRQAARLAESGSSYRYRDSCMAANLEWLLARRAPGTRAAVWAHNAHVQRDTPAGRGAMGAFVSRTFGDAFRVIGFATYDGTYSATRDAVDRTRVDATLFPSPAGSVEAALHQLRLPVAFTDLRGARSAPSGARSAPSGAWLLAPRPFRAIGFATDDYGFDESRLAREYDALVFVDHTTPSRWLR